MNPNNIRYDVSKPFQRTGNFALDISSIFTSYEDALKYAQGKGNDERKLGKSSYLGQIISVVDSESVKVYKITYDTDTHNHTLALIGEGSGGGGTVEQEIQIGDEIIEIGDTLTEALVKVAKVVNKKTDGTITDDIIISGETIVEKGTSVTEALQTVSNYLFEHSGSIAEIKPADDDLDVYVEDKITYLKTTGISNPQFEI